MSRFRMKRLAIVTTHPIQYYAPIFQLLTQRQKIDLKVFYTVGETYHSSKHDPGFGKEVSWDIPLMEGYSFQWVENISPNAGTRGFNGIKTPDLINEITEYKPDAVLVIGWSYHGHLQALRYFKNKIPVYFRGDSTLLAAGRGIKQLFKIFFLRWVYSHVDHAFYVGKNNKAYFTKYSLKESQLSFGPHAIDNERFGVSRAQEAAALRTSLKINREEILILFAGKFEPVKNVELLLTAFIKLKRPGVHLLLLGNGIDEEKLKDQAKSSEVAGNIHFVDFKNQSEMPVFYQAADLFCLPSKSESWGLSINEAMACGKAVLTSDKVGCATDLIIGGQNGAVFKEGDQESLADCLSELTLDKARLIMFGERAKTLIREWNFLNIAKAIEDKLLNEAN